MVNNPVPGDDKLSVLPTAVLATSENITFKKATNANLRLTRSVPLTFANTLAVSSSISTARPLDDKTRKLATDQVMKDLASKGIVDEKGNISKQTQSELSFELKTSIPTPGVVVKGCLDDCNVCEPAQQEQIKLELDHAKLKNQLLARRIELLEKSQEYRCCPVGEDEEVIES